MKEEWLKEVYNNIGRIILLNRLRKGLSQFNFGLEVNLSSNQVGRLERSESNPTVQTLVNICYYTGISEEVFFKKYSKEEIQTIEDEIKFLQDSKRISK